MQLMREVVTPMMMLMMMTMTTMMMTTLMRLNDCQIAMHRWSENELSQDYISITYSFSPNCIPFWLYLFFCYVIVIVIIEDYSSITYSFPPNCILLWLLLLLLWLLRIISTLLYPVSLLSGCWDRWSSQKPKYQYRDHLADHYSNTRPGTLLYPISLLSHRNPNINTEII